MDHIGSWSERGFRDVRVSGIGFRVWDIWFGV